MSRPNILLLFTDQQRFDTIQEIGSAFQAQTPHMDTLAREGIVFENCFCTAPLCSPSRATLISGLMPNDANMPGNLHNPCPPLPPLPSGLAPLMQAGGYETVYHGKWHLGGEICDHGFEIGIECNHDESTRQLASKFWRGRDWFEHDRPFFHMVSFLNPHDIYYFDPQKPSDRQRPWKNLSRPSESYPKTAQTQQVDWPESKWGAMTEFYEQLLERLDGEIGELLHEFICSGFAKESWIVFTSDHGDMCGEHQLPFKGSHMYEGQVHVPLIIIPPMTRFQTTPEPSPIAHNFPPGRRTQLCSLLDLPPTILDIAGLEKPASWQGESLLPLLRDPKAPAPHQTVFSCLSQPEIRMVRSQDWKYVCYENGEEELFHLKVDPHEIRNLAGNAACAVIQSELNSQLQRHET
ncbi:sulfatase-like hydrolase/transferase [Kiritimatiellota bacterium B12222]|nr:sulfatase-like hydrolase/transferase [Kiritimatiellota bacterium B12222]